MIFLAKLLRGISFIPMIVQGIEAVLGGRPGAEKKESALDFIAAAISMAEYVSSREIADQEKFRDGLSKIVDGVVQCLNASAWAKSR
ncbi:MAG TPA: hypothetical protein VNK82_11070 [Terriglobales bacterium]|nr:hypothetical protein [Terriglobales bacterium]